MEPARTERGRQLSAYIMIHPDPRKRAERDLQRTRPIGSPMEWILLHPTIQLRAYFFEISRFAGQQVSLRQHHQVLMPVQLPDDFVVAREAGIEVWNAPEIERICFDASNVIAPPADLGACFDHRSEQRKSMLPYLRRELHNILGRFVRRGQLQARNEVAAETGRGR